MFHASAGLREIAPLDRAYGPNRYSRGPEEWVVRDFFKDRRAGVFLDVGAHHFRDGNNTYFLETSLGWSGIAVDAQREFAAGYEKHRPRTRFFALFVSDSSDQTERLFVPDQHSVEASSDPVVTHRGYDVSVREVQTMTLNDLLDAQELTKVDFMSMDIELAEPKALAGFDIERFKPSLVCIEAYPEVRQQILDYFVRHSYVVVGRYLRLDPANLYFQPVP
jgi:FkbM family methyltransferase